MRITARENPRIRDLVHLTGSSRERRRRGVALLDGAHLVQSMAAQPLSAELLCASDGGLRHAEIERLFENTPSRRRLVLPDRLFEEISALASPSGILAVVAVPDPGPLPARIDDAVVLDGIQDTGNAGTILRTAAAAGIQTVIACAGTAFLWSPKVLRAAMGAHFQLKLYERGSADELVARASGTVAATTADGTRSLFEMDLRVPVVWIFGNEGGGVSAAARAAGATVRIPMAAGVESINVAISAAICLFEQRRQRLARA